MSDVTPVAEETPVTPAEATPETTPQAEAPQVTPPAEEETPITEKDLQDLIDRIISEPAPTEKSEVKDEPIPTSPQFA